MARLRWMAFALVALAYMLAFFHRVAPAAISTELQQTFAIGGAALGALAATYFYVYVAMQIPTGVLVDTLGPRRVITVGGLIAGVGSIVFGTAQTLSAAAAGRTLVGLGVSVMFIAMLKITSAWFPERQFGTASGFGHLLGNLGAILGAAPLAYVITLMPWGTVFVVVGVFSMLFALLTWMLMYDDPGRAGLPSMRELDGLAAYPARSEHWLSGLVRVVRNRESWPAFGVCFGMSGSFLAFAGLWAVPYLIQVHGMSREQAANHTSVMLLSFALGSLLFGAWSDWILRRRPLLVGSALAYALCWLPWLAATPLAPALGYGVFFVMGLCASGLTLAWYCSKELNPPALSGMATSLANSGGFLGAGMAQPLVGWVLDRAANCAVAPCPAPAEGFRWGLALLVCYALIGFASALLARETNCRNVTAP